MEAGSCLEGLAIVRQPDATLADDGVERLKVGNVFVDDRLVDELPKALGGLEFGSVGRKEQKPDSVGNLQIAFAMPMSAAQPTSSAEARFLALRFRSS